MGRVESTEVGGARNKKREDREGGPPVGEGDGGTRRQTGTRGGRQRGVGARADEQVEQVLGELGEAEEEGGGEEAGEGEET